MLPAWFPRPKSPIGLLSDVGQTVVGPPVLESLPRWEQIAPLEQPTSRATTTQVGDDIYFVGGENADGLTLAHAAVFNVRRGVWTPIADLPSPRANAASAWAGETLVVAGGSALDSDDVMTWTIFDDLLRYDPADDRWRTAGHLPMSLAGGALAVYDDHVYLVGGWDGSTVRAEVWRLPVAALDRASPADWEVVTTLPSPAVFFGSVVVDRTLYVVGGYDGRRELADAARYDLSSGVWQRLPPLSTPRSGLGLVNDGVSVVALGGGWGSTIQTHERLDTVTNQWVDIDSPIRGEWRHFGTAAHEGNIYMMGGWSGDYLATNLRFQSTFRAMLPMIPQGND
jgi:N-acetylneuraminic acid mutarotase